MKVVASNTTKVGRENSKTVGIQLQKEEPNKIKRKRDRHIQMSGGNNYDTTVKNGQVCTSICKGENSGS